ncbi:MAG: OmpA family protein [Bacteroidia bacterium]|nr:OmpA family protein [Bacteroidia bacterium]
MKTFLRCFLPVFTLLTACFPLWSQNATQKWGIGMGYTQRDFTGIPARDINSLRFSPAFHLSLNRYLNPSFETNLQASVVPFSFGKENPLLRDLGDADLLFRYKFNNGYILKETAGIAPYLLAGGSINTQSYQNPQFNFSVPLGLGFRIQTGIPVSFDFNAMYKLNVTDFQDYFSLNTGVVFNFGKKLPPPIVEDPDTDGDGIKDPLDDCPEVPGIARLNGCPDRDGDGIADSLDKCPDTFGLVEFEGCPDPDRDKDGTTNEKDDCPDEPGTPALKGCPDQDNDGIADRMDNCPDLAGIAALNGCPDRDGDGITDGEDACPDEAGTVELKGCPEIEQEVVEKLEFATKAVQFEHNSSILRQSSYAVLDTLVALMGDYPEYSLRASGHTDSEGNDGYNFELSEKRAKTCADYLISKGVASERLVYRGYGEAKPVADNITEEGKANNRRVEFELFVR